MTEFLISVQDPMQRTPNKSSISTRGKQSWSPFTLRTRYPWDCLGNTMVELGDTQRMGLLIGAAAILIFVVVNMAGLLGGGDEKLFIIDLIGIGSMDAMRPDTGFSTQDIVGLLVAAALGALYFLSAEEELDWEALLGDDDDEEE